MRNEMLLSIIGACSEQLNEVTAEAHIEDRTQRLLSYANSQDSEGLFNSSVVKTFYTTSCLMDVLEIWCNDDSIRSARKYAKWRATYINNCLKNGEVPT
uniref:Vta1/callose synthase N-terminal domain-containing protein n=1 Tax=Ditylenchus dipsaci TaxID=166011 RepID=A0A915DHN6_9BILA